MTKQKLFRSLWPWAEIKRLREDCAEAYQVVGTILFSCNHHLKYAESDLSRALDNLSAASSGRDRPHNDLIPWPMDIIP